MPINQFSRGPTNQFPIVAPKFASSMPTFPQYYANAGLTGDTVNASNMGWNVMPTSAMPPPLEVYFFALYDKK